MCTLNLNTICGFPLRLVLFIFFPSFFISLSSLYLSIFLSYICVYSKEFQPYPLMSSQEKGRPLPKFGEWDVNNPASADGFTVIFAKARDEKKTSGTAANGAPPQTNNHQSKPPENYQYPPPKKWFCCF